MEKKIFCFLLGTVKVIVNSPNIERFIAICIKRNILLMNISKEDANIIICEMRIKDFRNIKTVLIKTNSKIHIIDRYGLPFFLNRNRDRKVFLVAMVVSFAIIYFSTLFVWDIEVLGCDYNTKYEITETITDNFINGLTLRRKIHCEEIEALIRDEYKSVGWVTCEINGTKLLVKISETESGVEKNQNEEPCDIVSKCDCRISNMIVRNGTKIAEVSDEVKKGDVLISGKVFIAGDFDELIDTITVSADGDIKGEYIINYYDEFPINEVVKVENDESITGVNIFIFGKKLSFCKDAFLNSEIEASDVRFKIGKTFYLPIYYEKVKITGYSIDMKKLTNEEAKNKATKRLSHFIDEKGVEILENNVKMSIVSDRVITSGDLLVSEEVGVKSEISGDITWENYLQGR